jgi:hypothetical protein
LISRIFDHDSDPADGDAYSFITKRRPAVITSSTLVGLLEYRFVSFSELFGSFGIIVPPSPVLHAGMWGILLYLMVIGLLSAPKLIWQYPILVRRRIREETQDEFDRVKIQIDEELEKLDKEQNELQEHIDEAHKLSIQVKSVDAAADSKSIAEISKKADRLENKIAGKREIVSNIESKINYLRHNIELLNKRLRQRSVVASGSDMLVDTVRLLLPYCLGIWSLFSFFPDYEWWRLFAN